MQDDDTANPGMLWVLDGEALWTRKAGAAAQSCADCHGDAREHEGRGGALSGLRRGARPAGRSRAAHQHLSRRPATRDAVRPESKDLLALAASSSGNRAACRSRSRTTSAPSRFCRRGANVPPAPGQLNLSCAQCHDDNWGQKLAGAPIPQGQATGYPLYRLEWQAVGSLQRRLRNCLFGMRAVSYPSARPNNRSRALPDVARARHAVRGAGGAAVTHSIWKPVDFTIRAQCCNCSAMSATKSCGDPHCGLEADFDHTGAQLSRLEALVDLGVNPRHDVDRRRGRTEEPVVGHGGETRKPVLDHSRRVG